MTNKTILWADDDVDDLLLVKEILLKNNQSYNIVEVRNGKEALNYLSHKTNGELPCLIILDINMPVLDGKETLSILKNNTEYQSIPVVVFTTSNSEMDKLFCRKHQVEMVTKPPQYKSLEDAVLRLLNFAAER
jgi:CheY-like chemotaxis protein